MAKALLHELGKSLSYGRLSLKAKVLWPMLLASSDDQGRGLAEADAVKWYVCPNVPEIEIGDVPVLFAEMVKQEMVEVYDTDRGKVYQIVRWWEYQDLQWARPSKYASPDGWTDRIRYSNRGDYHAENWDTCGGFDVEQGDGSSEDLPSEPPRIPPDVPTQPNLTQSNSTESITPPSGEKSDIDPDVLFGEPSPSNGGEKLTKKERLDRLRNIAGNDPLTGALAAMETAQENSWTIPESAGGKDDWVRVADAFCCLHGLRIGDMPPKKQKQWPRKLQQIAESARASPEQMIEAIRAIPDSRVAFKIAGAYSTPYNKSFENDITMVIAQMATGQIVSVEQMKNAWSGAMA